MYLKNCKIFLLYSGPLGAHQIEVNPTSQMLTISIKDVNVDLRNLKSIAYMNLGPKGAHQANVTKLIEQKERVLARPDANI